MMRYQQTDAKVYNIQSFKLSAMTALISSEIFLSFATLDVKQELFYQPCAKQQKEGVLGTYSTFKIDIVDIYKLYVNTQK